MTHCSGSFCVYQQAWVLLLYRLIWLMHIHPSSSSQLHWVAEHRELRLWTAQPPQPSASTKSQTLALKSSFRIFRPSKETLRYHVLCRDELEATKCPLMAGMGERKSNGPWVGEVLSACFPQMWMNFEEINI